MVTYAGQPLYFYEHDPKGEVLCNDIVEFGGTWFAVTAEGKAARLGVRPLTIGDDQPVAPVQLRELQSGRRVGGATPRVEVASPPLDSVLEATAGSISGERRIPARTSGSER